MQTFSGKEEGILTVFLLLLVFASLLGYALFLFTRFSIRSELLPILVCCSVTTLLFLFGLIRMLLPGAVLLFVSGLALLVFCLIRRKASPIKWRIFFSPGVLLFLAGCIYFFCFLWTARLYAYDDFSHWGLIVKSLLAENAFPSGGESIVTFPTYPPGSALFCYYFGLFTQGGEPVWLGAQMVLLCAGASSLFALTGSGKRAILSGFLAAGAGLLMLTLFQQALSTLLVDTLLPVVALANLPVLLVYRNQAKRAALLSLPLLSMTILIKNNGLFFAGIHLILLAILFWRKSNRAKNRRYLWCFCCALLIPLLLFAGWKLHLAFSFPPEVQSGHHAMNLSNYLQTFQEKSPQLRAEITQKFLRAATDPATRNSRIMLSFQAAALLICLFIRLAGKRTPARLLGAVCAADALYVLYLLGIYLMYLFSMPAAEASSFESFNRYGISMVIYAVGWMAAGMLWELKQDALPGGIFLGTAAGFLILLGYCFGFTHAFETLTVRPAYETTRPYRMDQALESAGWKEGESILLYLPESASDYRFSYYLAKYKLASTRFELAAEVGDPAEFETKIEVFDHFAVVVPDAAVEPYLALQH